MAVRVEPMGFEDLLKSYIRLKGELLMAQDEIERLQGDLAAAESTIAILENPELRAALTAPTAGDYGPVPNPHDVR